MHNIITFDQKELLLAHNSCHLAICCYHAKLVNLSNKHLTITIIQQWEDQNFVSVCYSSKLKKEAFRKYFGHILYTFRNQQKCIQNIIGLAHELRPPVRLGFTNTCFSSTYCSFLSSIYTYAKPRS